MGTLTFVLGYNHYCATLYIRERVHKGDEPNRFRNITNPHTLRGLRSTEKTTIELVLLPNWRRGRKGPEFELEIQNLRSKSAGIVETHS